MTSRLGFHTLLQLDRPHRHSQLVTHIAVGIFLATAVLAVFPNSAWAAERITLKNGFEIVCDHHAQYQRRFLVFLSKDPSDFIVLPLEEIASIESLSPSRTLADSSTSPRIVQGASSEQQAHTSSEIGGSNALVKAFSSEAEIGDAGRIQVIWLKPELVNQLVQDRAKELGKVPAQVQAASREIDKELDFEDSLTFLIIFRPNDRGFLSQPGWGSNHTPAIQLMGTGSFVENPIAWSQNLGEGRTSPRWYSGLNYGYVSFESRRPSGKPVIADSDFTLTVRGFAVPSDGKVYSAAVDFYFNASHVPLQSIIDENAPIGYPPTVSLTAISSSPDQLATNGGQEEVTPQYLAAPTSISEADRDKITFGDAISVGGFVLQLLELFFAK